MTERKNVLFIVADQFRWDCLGVAGHPVVQTPNLDALARDGVRFDRCFVQCAPCGPSRACMLTSRYACSHRSIDNMTPLMDAHESLPVHLRRHGYLPVILGYNDYAVDPRILPTDDPRARGLSYANFLPGWHMTYYHEYDSPEWFDYLRQKGYPESILNREAIHAPDVPPEGPGEHLPLRYPARYHAEDSESRFMTGKALEYIRQARGSGWFMNVNYIKPHPPRIAPAPYNDMYDPRDAPPPNRRESDLTESHPYYRLMSRDRQQPSDLHLGDIRANYYGMISELDACLGSLFDGLKEMGDWNRTLIVFTSDHGEYLGDHYLMEKGHFYDEGIRVPLIVRDPGKEADGSRGTTVSGFVESIDLAPTMLEFLDMPIPDRFQGRSVLGNIRGDGPLRSEVHYEFDFRNRFVGRPDVDPDRCLLWVVRDGEYKYVQFADEDMPPLLFDLRSDPGEHVNLAQDPGHAGTVARYCQRLLRWRMKHEDQRMEHWAAQYR